MPEHNQETKDLTLLPPLNFAVFTHHDIVALVALDTLETGRNAAEAAGTGFHYAGTIGVNGGEVTVACEPGYETAMVRGGWMFAGHLGEHLKRFQTQGMGMADAPGSVSH